MDPQKMETQKTKIAVVVLNWNGKDWLIKFIPSLIKNSQEATIFVADNNSDDDSIQLLKNKFPLVRIIQLPSNDGYAAGYNNALKQINAEYFILINSDIETTKGWINPIIDLMDKDLDIAACQPKILDYNKRDLFEYAGGSGGFIDVLGYPFCRGRIFNTLEKDEGQYNNIKEVFWASGACFFVRSSYFKDIGGLDDDFFAHQEEIDLCWRFKNTGYKIMVNPDSIVYHVGGGTLESSSSFKTYLNFRNNLFMIFKNLTLRKIILVLPIRFLLDGLAAISFISKPNGINHCIAVIKAHFSFYLAIGSLLKKRSKIKQTSHLEGMYNKSILLKYYIRKITKYQDL